MLLEFKTQNYRSFADEVVFSMISAPKQRELEYSLLKEKIGSKEFKGLCSSVIYGPNASGKTNIIGAIDTLRSVVLRGNIKNAEDATNPNYAMSRLELIPNNKLTKSQPVKFFIDFTENGFRIQYTLNIDIGGFLDMNYDRKVLLEKLEVNGEIVFIRDDKIYIGNLKLLKDYATDYDSNFYENIKTLTESSLNADELFLTNGFRIIVSPKFSELIINWFREKLFVIYRADSMNRIWKNPNNLQNSIYAEKVTNEAAKIFGLNANAVGYISENNDSDAQLVSVIDYEKNNVAIPAEMFESYGTVRFINLFPMVLEAVQSGGALIVDEFDASIHPMAIMNILTAFHNDDININHAQLIFNTHNPIFLNSNLLRRDEIKFVERDDETDFSTLYSLSDFGTSGENGVRKGDDYMKHYFVGRYGAVKDIDFTSVFEEVLSAEGQAKKNGE